MAADKAFPKMASILLITPDIFGAVNGFLLKSRNRESLVLVASNFSLF